jgi:BirA family biotin operon repressor/biotin-[acetyl-CoA-carboxylase] ligase
MQTASPAWQHFNYPVLSSTNDKALEYSRTRSKLPAVFTAEEQTQGRGRRGRQWVSTKGNLFMSLLLKAEVSISDFAFISSLALAQTIDQFSPTLQPKIKWPNDVLINGCKISGILIESAENDCVIIGIGVNLCSSPDNSEVIYPTTNLKTLGVELDRLTFLKAYLSHFNQALNQRLSIGFEPIRQNWLGFAWHLNDTIKIRQHDQEISGIFKGIDEQGFLLLKQGKEIKKIVVGDVFI